MPPPGDDLETVQHPTLGALKFPKDMSQEDRTKSIDYAIKQKYGLPEDVDLRQEYTHTPANLGSDIEKFGRAYQEAHAGEKETTGQKVKRALGVEEGAGFGGGGWGGGMAPRTVEETLAPAFYGATEAAGAVLGPPIGRAARALWKVLGPSESRVAGERVAAAGEAAGERAGAKTLPAIGRQVERVMPPAETIPPARPPLPSADVQLNQVAQRIFKKPYGQLTSEEQIVVARNTGGTPAPGAERRTLVGQAPTIERRAGAMPLPTKAPAAVAERRLADVGPPAGGLDQRQINRDIQTLTATQPMKANLLSSTFEDWKKATGTEKDVLADRIRGMQEEMKPVPGVAGRAPEPSIFKPGETVTGMKPERRMSREEAEAASAERTAGRQARFAGPPAPPGTLPLTPAATPTPAPPAAAPGPTLAGIPTEQELAQQARTLPTTRARATVPAAPAPTTLPSTQPAAANVPQGTPPALSLDEILRRATGQPEPPQPGVPLREQLGKG